LNYLPREDFKRAYSWFRSRLEEAVTAEDYSINSAKCQVYIKRNKYAKFHYAVIL
jgi:hypothetical protein